MQQALLNLAAAPQLAERHQSSGLNSTFHGGSLSFDDYVRVTDEMLRQVHTKLNTPNSEKIIAGNLPFMLKPERADGKNHPYRRGILLTHGLTDSPYFMRPLADFFAQQGFLVMVILLPGHGTQPGDLLDVVWQEWAKAVAYGTDCLAQQADEIYLGGLSTGATLSVQQSLNDARVRGLFLFSPALKITPRAAFAKVHKLYSWLIPAAKWVTLQPDNDSYKYESFPKNGAAQMYALTRHIQANLAAVHIPIFAVTSADDETVDSSASLKFMAHARHIANKILVYSTTPNNIPAEFSAQKFVWLNSVFTEQKILSSAHTAIVLPASDPHYGSSGEYVNCAHYYPHEMAKYIACRTRPNEAELGEVTQQNLRRGIVRRLMFNPDFLRMTEAIKQFITTLPESKKQEESC